MTDRLQSSPTLLTEPIAATEALNTALDGSRASIDSVTVSQIIFRLANPPATAPLHSVPEIHSTVLDAMQRLVEMVGELRSAPMPDLSIHETPDATLDEISTDIQTPNTLLPYVQEEIQDVLDALSSHASSRSSSSSALDDHQPPTSISTTSPFFASSPSSYVWLKTLAPWFLWAIARCHHDVMRFMEGQPAQITRTEQPEQVGMVRLVPILTLQTSSGTYAIDLATLQSSPTVLSEDCLVQLETGFCSQALTVGDLTQHLTEQIQLTTPAIAPFLHGMGTDLLIPQHRWQAGHIQLHLEIEFTSMPPRPTLSPVISSIPFSPSIQFTDADWIADYTQRVREHQMKTLLTPITTRHVYPEAVQLPTPSDLMDAAWSVADRLQTNLTIASRNLFGAPLPLDHLASRLMWGFMHGGYEVMQLLSGVRAHILSPQSPYQTGSLRFLATLIVKTPELDYTLDVMTTHPPNLNGRSPSPDVIVQLPEHQWCTHPRLLEELEHMIWTQIEQTTPELQCLLQGTDVNVLADDRDWQLGGIQLDSSFEFIPD